VDVVGPINHDPSRRLLEPWLTVQRTGRPYVHLKLAASVDGRVAAADGTSQWISGEASRREVHAMRADCDAVLVGTGTVLADDPALTVRHVSAEKQPLRVVIGNRDLPANAQVLDSAAPTVHLRTHDVKSALADLIDREVGSVLVEGGPTVAGAFLAAGAVDRITVFTAPLLLGSGTAAVADAGISTLLDGIRFDIDDLRRCGEDVVISGLIRRAD
jgi:diaminohydroxyphosphoribosylaminopyrimidine deaminase/5-amino-6-(5-phosphoribosylamino)uracil reductase